MKKEIIRTQIGRSDLKAFFFCTVWSKHSYTIPCLMAAFGIGILLVLDANPYYMWLGIVMIIYVAWFVVSKLLLQRKFLSPVNNQTIYKYVIEISSDRLLFNDETNGTSQNYKWSSFVFGRESARYFFLYLAPFTAIILPKRDISPSFQSELRGHLRMVLKNKFTRF